MARFAYADPPYLSCGARYYGRPEWDQRATHLNLTARLLWNIPTAGHFRPAPPISPGSSLSAPTIVWLEPGSNHSLVQPASASGSSACGSQSSIAGRDVNTQIGERTRDALVTNPTRELGLIGAKPQPFNRWILDLLGYVEGDRLDDLFPGTAGMARAIEAPILPMQVSDD